MWILFRQYFQIYFSHLITLPGTKLCASGIPGSIDHIISQFSIVVFVTFILVSAEA